MSRRPNVWAKSHKPLDLDAALRRAGRNAPIELRPGGPLVGWIPTFVAWFKVLAPWAKFLFGIAAAAGLYYFAQLLRRPTFNPETGSRTYGFDAPHNTTGAGAALPVVYGQHKVFGHVVQAFIETINDDQFYNILLCLSEGEINSISGIKINDQPVANFADVQTETRVGTSGQAKIPWFDDTRTTRSHGVALNNDATASTFTTVATNITAFVVALKFPLGLYTLDGNGNLKSNVVNITIEYRTPPGSGTWTLLTTTDIREAKRNSFTRAFRKDNLTAGRYDIRVTRNSTGDRSSASAFDMTYDTVDEITYGNTNFPNIALLGVRIRATEQLSGGLPQISCTVEGRKVRTRSGGAWTAELYNRNPVWCVVDVLTNTRYGMGNYIVDADLDIPALESAAAYCEDLLDDLQSGTHARFRLDVVLDQQSEAWDVVERILRTFRASVIESDNKYRLVIDRQGTVSQAFGNANMVRDSFVNGWVSIREEFNQVEVVFVDEASNWVRETVRFPSSVGSPKLKTIELQGVTRRAHALREAKYHMNAVSALSRYIEFDAFLEGLAVEVGDVIEVSHDVPQWGYNGRVVAAAVNGANHDITVDRDDLPTPTAHSMLMRHDDDVVESRTVVSKSGRVVTCAAFSKLPVARDSVFMYGPTGATSKKFRVMQMGLTKELRAHIVGIEYDETIYDATGLVLPARSPSQLPIFTAPPGSITGLTLITQLIRNNQGIDTYRLQIHWNNPVWIAGQGQYHHAQIWLSTDGGALYQKVGEQIEAPAYTPVVPLATYFVKVVSVSVSDVAQALSAAATASITITGDVTAPAVPTGLTSVVFGKVVQLDWNDNTEADFYAYEVWRNTVDNNGTATKQADVHASKFEDLNVNVGTTYFYWVKARDIAGNTSAFSASTSVGPTSLGSAFVAFTASGSWLVPGGVSEIRAECWAGGGGGGTADASGANGAGGGGGGGYAAAVIPVTPGETLTITVGAGGASNTAGGLSSILRGATDLIKALGGSAGASSSGSGQVGDGGAGGTGLVGDLKISGQKGEAGKAHAGNYSWGGRGGGSPKGGSLSTTGFVPIGSTPVASGESCAPGGGGRGGYGSDILGLAGAAGANGLIVLVY